jgi:hypothetical protein
VTWRSAVVRWCTVRVVVASVFLAQAVSRRLLVRLLATATRSVFTRQFGTAAPASAAVVGRVGVWRGNCVTGRGAARLARTVCDWRRRNRGSLRNCAVLLLTMTSVVMRSWGRVRGLHFSINEVPAVLVLGQVVLVLFWGVLLTDEPLVWELFTVVVAILDVVAGVVVDSDFDILAAASWSDGDVSVAFRSSVALSAGACRRNRDARGGGRAGSSSAGGSRGPAADGAAWDRLARRRSRTDFAGTGRDVRVHGGGRGAVWLRKGDD